MQLPEILQSLIDDLAEQQQVDAVLIAGSQTTGSADEKSDYDIYVYLNRELPAEVRGQLLDPRCVQLELDNRYWETEDNGVLKGGYAFDLVYRGLDWVEEHIAGLLEKGNAGTGYSTCIWHNFQTSRILFDREGRAAAMQNRFAVSYPDLLRDNIIRKNRALLSGKIPSYDGQILKAACRGDRVSVQHRKSAFLESYFDILYAFNRLPHPGEKRMLESLEKPGAVCPEGMRVSVEKLLDARNTEELEQSLEGLLSPLDNLLQS